MNPVTTLGRLLVSAKAELDPGVYTIVKKKYIRETKIKLKTGVKEHREEVDKLMECRPFTLGTRKESATDRWKSAITDHAINQNHVID